MLPPIMFGKNTKNKNLFPKLGGMGLSAYANVSPYSSIYANRVVLDNTIRDKVRTGQEVTYKQPKALSSSRSLEDYESESKQLTNYNKNRRGVTINSNSVSTDLVTIPVIKNSVEKKSKKVAQNQIVLSQSNIKQRINLRVSPKNTPRNKLKSNK
jgi:hypothetical protein